jgi:hypothetical protein
MIFYLRFEENLKKIVLILLVIGILDNSASSQEKGKAITLNGYLNHNAKFNV